MTCETFELNVTLIASFLAQEPSGRLSIFIWKRTIVILEHLVFLLNGFCL